MTIKTQFAAALTALTLAAAVTLPSTQAEARGGAIAAGLIGGAILGAAVASHAYAGPGPGYYYGPAPRRCHWVARYDSWGNYMGRGRVCRY